MQRVVSISRNMPSDVSKNCYELRCSQLFDLISTGNARNISFRTSTVNEPGTEFLIEEVISENAGTCSYGLASLSRQVWARKLCVFELKGKKKESFEED